MKVENSYKIENGEKKRKIEKNIESWTKKKTAKKFHEYLDNFCLGLEIKVVNKIDPSQSTSKNSAVPLCCTPTQRHTAPCSSSATT